MPYIINIKNILKTILEEVDKDESSGDNSKYYSRQDFYRCVNNILKRILNEVDEDESSVDDSEYYPLNDIYNEMIKESDIN